MEVFSSSRMLLANILVVLDARSRGQKDVSVFSNRVAKGSAAGTVERGRSSPNPEGAQVETSACPRVWSVDIFLETHGAARWSAIDGDSEGQNNVWRVSELRRTSRMC